MLTAAKQLALQIAEGKFKRKDKRSLIEKLLEGNPITKRIIFSKARQIALAKSYGNYPAIPSIVESIAYGSSHNRDLSSQREVELFDKLLSSPEAFQLINLFFGMTALKKNPMKKEAKPINTVGVLGAGLMGQGIAEVTMNAEMDVMIKDINEQMLSKARRNIWKSLSKKIKYKSITKAGGEKKH